MRTAAAALLALSVLGAPRAQGQGAVEDTSAAARGTAAAADSALGDYLRQLADTTDVTFGPSSAPFDTAGLDSALAFRLAYPDPMRDMRRARPSYAPWFSFNRVDGPLYGAALTLGSADRWGAISGRAGYAVGPNDWLGGVMVRKRWAQSRGRPARSLRRRGEEAWTLEASAGRFSAVLDPDRSVSWQRVFRALVNGSDGHHYFRRDGVHVRLQRQDARSRLALVVRDQLETPMVTTTTWNLFGTPPLIEENHPAAAGRAREFQVEAALRIPKTALQTEAGFRQSSRRWESDFDYQRLYLAAGGDVGLGKVAALIPQVQYGRLDGDPVSQAVFYLGGPYSLRSIDTNSRSGTGKALGRLDVIFNPDLLALMRLPHPAFVSIQGGLFAASGSVWGPDVLAGTTRERGLWPEAGDWLSEVGAALMYRPGVPWPDGYLRLDYGYGVGNNTESKLTLHYSVPLNIVRPVE